VFRAANLSTAFQVRKLGMTDVTAYPVGFQLQGLESPDDGTAEEEADGKKWTKRANLFKRFHKLAKRKTVTFTNAADFVCALSHESPEYLPAGARCVLNFILVLALPCHQCANLLLQCHFW